jgi:rhodanese-related sulfurtransferase
MDPNQIKMNAKRIVLLIVVGLATLTTAVTGWAARELTDPEKLQHVYLLYSDYQKEFPQVRDVSAPDVLQMLKSGQKIVFVDTRRPEEIEVSKLPEAISKKMFLARDPAEYKDSIIIAYCTISYRSGIFARDLTEEGRDIYNLRGGLLAWVLEGGKVYDADGVTRRIHVYGGTWEYAPAGYETLDFSLWKQFLPF